MYANVHDQALRYNYLSMVTENISWNSKRDSIIKSKHAKELVYHQLVML